MDGKKLPKIIFWVVVVCLVAATIYGGYTCIQTLGYFKGKMEDANKYLFAEVYNINSSLRIATLNIVQGYPCQLGEIKWVLKLQGKDTEINLYAIEKNQKDFTDENLFNDTQYQIYWNDVDDSGSINIGDYLKVKVPQKDDYIIQGKIVFGKTKSGETIYTTIFGKEINLSDV